MPKGSGSDCTIPDFDYEPTRIKYAGLKETQENAMAGCPTCGAELTYVPQYGRHYCYGCRSYAPKDLRECEECGRALVFIEQYQTNYCYGCQEYKEDEMVSEEPRGNAIGHTSFSREDLDLASKEELMSWCEEFGLDDSGMKYELRLRLLEHIRKQGMLLKGEKPVQLVKEELPEPEVKEAEEEDAVLEEILAEEDEAVTAQPEAIAATEKPSETAERTCANCGAALTYIPQYGRWYCYSCHNYADAKPARRTMPRPQQTKARSAQVATKAAKKGGNPMVGISLAALGLLLFIGEMLLFRAPRVFDFPVFIRSPDVEFALQLLSMVFIVLGLTAAIVVRSRH